VLRALFWILLMIGIGLGFISVSSNRSDSSQGFSLRRFLDRFGLYKVEGEQKRVVHEKRLAREQFEERFASLEEKERTLRESTQDKVTQFEQKREVSLDPRQLKQKSEDLTDAIEQKKNRIVESRKLQEEQQRRLKELTESRKAILEDRLWDQRLK